MLEAKFVDDPVVSFHSSIFKKNECLESIVKLSNLPKKKKLLSKKIILRQSHDPMNLPAKLLMRLNLFGII